MVATYAPSPRQPVPGRTEPERSEFGFNDPDNMTVWERAAARRRRDPSPAEIAAMCAEIRKGWSEAEHRYRAGMAPVDPLGRMTMARTLEDFGGVRGWRPPVCRCGLAGNIR